MPLFSAETLPEFDDNDGDGVDECSWLLSSLYAR